MSNQKEMMIVTIKLKVEVDVIKYLDYLLVCEFDSAISYIKYLLNKQTKHLVLYNSWYFYITTLKL